MHQRTVLIAHVPYQHRGGEDIHVELLAEVYRGLGYQVRFLPEERTPPKGFLRQAIASLVPGWCGDEIGRRGQELKPSVVHVHNLYPVLGPRFLRNLIGKKVPVIATAHNHRFYCTNGLALRNGKNCKLCRQSLFPWRSILFNCNQNWSRTLYYFFALSLARVFRLFDRAIDRWIAPSPYIAGELEKSGVGCGKISEVIHPIVSPPRAQNGQLAENARFDVIYAGRLSPEKGVLNLIQLVAANPKLSFAIVGDGPLAADVEESKQKYSNLHYFSKRSHDEVIELIGQSRVGILPSICNEILSLFALEVFSQGKRCVVSDTESMRWFAQAGFPALLARTGDIADFSRVIAEAILLPAPEEAEFKLLRSKLGVQRYASELQAVIQIAEKEKGLVSS